MNMDHEIIINYPCVPKKDKKKDNEIKYFDPFARFYSASFFPNIKEINIEFPDIKIRNQKAPDFYLAELETTVELVGVHDKKNRSSTGSFEKSEEILRKDLESRDLSSLNGFYLAITHPGLYVRNKKEARLLNDKLLDAIKNSQSSIKIEKYGSFQFRKLGNGKNDLDFYCFGFGIYNPIEIIYNNLIEQFKEANKKLDEVNNYSAKKKIVLLVNHCPFANDVIEFKIALSKCKVDLDVCANIGEIWLQFPIMVKHELLYSRTST